MQGGGGLGVMRGSRPEGFIAEHKAVGGASLRAKATKSWYGPRHGRSTVEGGGVGAECGPDTNQ
jgi:hypothetical protein